MKELEWRENWLVTFEGVGQEAAKKREAAKRTEEVEYHLPTCPCRHLLCLKTAEFCLHTAPLQYIPPGNCMGLFKVNIFK